MNVMQPALLHFSLFTFNWLCKTRLKNNTNRSLIRLVEVRQVIKEELTPIPNHFPESVKSEIKEFVEQFDTLLPIEIWNQQEAFYKSLHIKDVENFMTIVKKAENEAFENWMAELDARFCAEYGLSIYDLPDMCYRDWFDAGSTPAEIMDEEFSDLETMRELIMG